MSEPDFDTFPLWRRGNQFEDFEVDQVFKHHWGRTLTAGDATLFSSVALRYCPLYVNAEYAKSERRRDMVVLSVSSKVWRWREYIRRHDPSAPPRVQ